MSRDFPGEPLRSQDVRGGVTRRFKFVGGSSQSSHASQSTPRSPWQSEYWTSHRSTAPGPDGATSRTPRQSELGDFLLAHAACGEKKACLAGPWLAFDFRNTVIG